MQSILLHIYDDSGFESRFQAALDLARAFDGHLTCLHATPFEDYLATDPLVAARIPEEFSEKMKTLRLALKAKVEARLASEGVSWDWVHLDESMSAALISFSILSDIVVVSLAGPAIYKDDPRPLAATVAIGARAPVLAVPPSAGPLDLDAPIVIAWNGSAEAAAAMRSALPLLPRASAVHLVEVEEKPSAYPRDLAARYLARHGIGVQIVQWQPKDGSTGDAISEAAREFGAGLIVMGAYGRPRLLESLLGGVTRDLITRSEIPLLLAH